MTDHESDNDNTRTYMVLTQGTMVQHYRIVEKIGAGGMGEVYLAEDTKLKRKVAIKFLPTHLIANKEIMTRFVREAQTVAKLNHPNIVSIYDVSEHSARPYYVMELIEGESLYDSVRDKPLALDIVIDYAIQICQGLGEAHRAGIVHRDIKSANIAVDKQGRIRLLDFGLAAAEGDEKLTKTGSTLGTVSYMSPEQISGREIDHRSDLFSLGIVLYELLAGTTPFKRDNEGATLKAIMEDSPEPLTRYKADVPEKLQAIIFELLEKDKEIRYQSAEGVIAHLKRLTYDSRQPAASTRTDLPKRSKTLPILFASIVVISLSIWALFFRGSNEVVEEYKPVLIVLPFQNLGAADDEYFADGIRDEIGSRLSTVKGLRVISPRSAEKYKNVDKSIQQIGQETGANFVLEATIRWDKSGDVDRIRIIPRLTKTSDNYLMWSDNYERELIQIFDVQSQIAEQIVLALDLTLLETGKDAPDYAPTTNMKAYNYYLRGLDLNSKGIFMSNLSEVINMYDSAIALDSSFALAWAKKSITHSLYEFSYTARINSRNEPRALEAAEKALELDPNLPDAHIALGTYHNWIERDYDKALNEFAMAESEVASNADLSEAIGIVKMRQGKWPEALEYFEEAARLDPLTVRRYFYLGIWYSYHRDLDMAQQYIDRGLSLAADDFESVHFKIKFNLLQYGTVDSRDITFEEIVQSAGVAGVSLYEVGPSSTPAYWRYVIDRYDPDRIIVDLRAIDETATSPYLIYMNVAQVFDLSDRKDSARLYYDSARISLELAQDYDDEDFHISSNLALAYAFLGMDDSAIAAAKRGKELMSVDDCHW